MTPASAAPVRERLLTIEEAAEYLGVKTRMIRKLIETRRIAFVKVGRLVRLRESDLQAAIEEWTVAPTAQRSPRWR